MTRQRPKAADFFSDPQSPVTNTQSPQTSQAANLSSKGASLTKQDSIHDQTLAIEYNAASPTYQRENRTMGSQDQKAPHSTDLLSALTAFVNDAKSAPVASRTATDSDPFAAIFGGSYHSRPAVSLPPTVPTAPAAFFATQGKKPGSLFAGLKIKKNRAVSPIPNAPKGPKGWVEGQVNVEDSGYLEAPLETPALTIGSSTSSRNSSPLSAVSSAEREVTPANTALEQLPDIGTIFSNRHQFESTCRRIAEAQGCHLHVASSLLRGAGQHHVQLKCTDALCKRDLSIIAQPKSTFQTWEVKVKVDNAPLDLVDTSHQQTRPTSNTKHDPQTSTQSLSNNSAINTTENMPKVGDTFDSRAAFETIAKHAAASAGCKLSVFQSRSGERPHVDLRCWTSQCKTRARATFSDDVWTVSDNVDPSQSTVCSVEKKPSGARESPYQSPAKHGANASTSALPPASSTPRTVMPSVGDTFATRTAFDQAVRKAAEEQGCSVRVTLNRSGNIGRQKVMFQLGCKDKRCNFSIKAHCDGGIWSVIARNDDRLSIVHPGKITPRSKASKAPDNQEAESSGSEMSVSEDETVNEDAPYEDEDEDDDVPLSQIEKPNVPKRSSTGRFSARRSPSAAAEIAVARGSLSLPNLRLRVPGERADSPASQIGLKSRYTSTEALIDAAETFTGYNTSSSYTSAGNLRLECKAKKTDYPGCSYSVIAAFLPGDQSWEIIEFQPKHVHFDKRSVSVGAMTDSKKRKSDGYTPRASSSRMAPIADGPKGRIDWETERLEQLTKALNNKVKSEPKEQVMEEKSYHSLNPVTAYDYHKLDIDALVGNPKEGEDTNYEWPAKRARTVANASPQGVRKRDRSHKEPLTNGIVKFEEVPRTTRTRTPSSSFHHSITPMAVDEVDPSEKKDDFCILIPSPKDIKRDRTHSASPKTVGIEDSPMISAGSPSATSALHVSTQLSYEPPSQASQGASIASTSAPALAGPIQMRQSKVGRDLRKLLEGLGEGLGAGPADALIAAGLNDCNRLKQLNPVSWPAFCEIVLKKNPQITEFEGFLLKDSVLKYLVDRQPTK